MGGEKSIVLTAQPGPLVTNQGLPRMGEQRSCQSSLLLHGAPMAAQVATKVPQHVATSELPLTTTTQGRCRQGLVLPGWRGGPWPLAAGMRQPQPQPGAGNKSHQG